MQPKSIHSTYQRNASSNVKRLYAKQYKASFRFRYWFLYSARDIHPPIRLRTLLLHHMSYDLCTQHTSSSIHFIFITFASIFATRLWSTTHLLMKPMSDVVNKIVRLDDKCSSAAQSALSWLRTGTTFVRSYLYANYGKQKSLIITSFRESRARKNLLTNGHVVEREIPNANLLNSQFFFYFYSSDCEIKRNAFQSTWLNKPCSLHFFPIASLL